MNLCFLLIGLTATTFHCGFVGGPAFAQDQSGASIRPDSSRPSPEHLGALGLTARLDRATGIYAIGDDISLVVNTRVTAQIEIWNISADGEAVMLTSDPNEQYVVFPGQDYVFPNAINRRLRVRPPAGRNEFVIIAKAVASRSLGFDPTLAAGGSQEEVIIPFTIIE